MALLLDSFWRAVVYCMHPRVIALSLMPLLLMGVLALGLSHWYWDAAVALAHGWLDSWGMAGSFWGWLADLGWGDAKSYVAPSMVVALVAAPNSPLPLANAIPIIMGANIGTTVTNTLVSLGHAGRKDEFRRAFAAATCHDFFNFMVVFVLLPLELATGYLEKVSGLLAGWLQGGGGAKPPNPLKKAVHFGLQPLHDGIDSLIGSPKGAAVALLVVSAASANAAQAAARALPHLGRYGWVVFEDGRSSDRGHWPSTPQSITLPGSIPAAD